MGLLVIVLIVAACLAIYGNKTTFLGSVPVFLLGMVIGGSGSGNQVVRALGQFVSGLVSWANGIS